MKHLRTVLSENGYPTGLVKPTHTKDKNQDQEEEEEKPLTTAVIPYSQGLSEQIRRVLRMYNIRTAFRSGASLGNLLTKVKDPVPVEDRPGAIYKISSRGDHSHRRRVQSCDRGQNAVKRSRHFLGVGQTVKRCSGPYLRHS